MCLLLSSSSSSSSAFPKPCSDVQSCSHQEIYCLSKGRRRSPKVSRLGPLDMARFLVSGCYVMGRTEECVQVFESLYHMDIHQCGQVWVCRGGRVGDSDRSSLWRWLLAVFCPERNVLFNDALNTFYLRLYGVRHMVKDHSDSEKGNPLPPHRLLLSINSKGSFICTIPQTG